MQDHRTRWALCGVVCVWSSFALGCDGGSESPDIDAATHDSATHDSAVHDSAAHDATAQDGAAPDAAVQDSATPDAAAADASADANTGGCAASPCYTGVACTDLPGETPSYSCGDCPNGYSGDGVTCTEDADPPTVVSTNPAQDAAVRFDAGAFNPGEINRITITFNEGVFDRSVAPAVLSLTLDHASSNFSANFAVQTRVGPDGTDTLTFVTDGTPYHTFPGGAYTATLQGVRGYGGGTLDLYTWEFTVRACGDGTCDSDESSCTCSDDCGACAGCCNQSSQCLAGTANNACGAGGASCGVCLSPDVCAPNGQGCI